MALKPDRDPLTWDISRFWGDIRGITTSTKDERGGIAVATGTVGSGAALDQTSHQAQYVSDPSGRGLPVGMLMNDVVNIDLTRQLLNPNKSEHQLGDKVTLMRKGWAVTNLLAGGGPAITAEATAYLAGSGYITPDSGSGRPVIGKFMSNVDEDGYTKVFVDL